MGCLPVKRDDVAIKQIFIATPTSHLTGKHFMCGTIIKNCNGCGGHNMIADKNPWCAIERCTMRHDPELRVVSRTVLVLECIVIFFGTVAFQ